MRNPFLFYKRHKYWNCWERTKMYGYTIQLLKLHGIIMDNKLVTRFRSRLLKTPELMQMIADHTSFLQYDAEINVRVQCILQSITEQPACLTCDGILKMRTTGKYTNTFPTFCCQKCSATHASTKQKRADTNISRYGSSNYLTSEVATKKSN